MNKEKNEADKTNKGKEAVKVGGPWIVKPHDAAGGRGISLVQCLSDIGYLGMVQMVSKWKKVVVSQYAHFPPPPPFFCPLSPFSFLFFLLCLSLGYLIGDFFSFWKHFIYCIRIGTSQIPF